jgi:hypothetical protein
MNKHSMTLRMSEKEHNKLQKASSDLGISMSAYIHLALFISFENDKSTPTRRNSLREVSDYGNLLSGILNNIS